MESDKNYNLKATNVCQSLPAKNIQWPEVISKKNIQWPEVISKKNIQWPEVISNEEYTMTGSDFK
jgi:hypothetical protein